MRLRLPCLAFFAFAGLLVAAPAAAWGRPAHRVVANLAQAQLRPGARAEADRLLAGEPEPGLAAISAWADDMDKDGGQPGRHGKHWHYVDFRGGPGGCDYVPARDCREGDCVVAAIEREFQRLADRSRPDAERAEALKYLVHYVADVHQPLHATPVRDKGGLDFQVNWRGEGTNLHKLWDVAMLQRALEHEHVDEAGYVRALQGATPLPRDNPGSAADWAQESCRLVRDGAIYPDSHKLDEDYLDAHRALMEQRLRLAGARLADVLNSALDPREPR